MSQLIDAKSLIANFKNIGIRVKQTIRTAGWLGAVRSAAVAEFEQKGFPSKTAEAWRFTNVAPIAKTAFQSPEVADLSAARDTFKHFSFGDDAVCELVFVDGHFAASFSKLAQFSNSKVLTFTEALRTEAELMQKHLSKYADIKANPFVALNTGCIDEGALVVLRSDTKITTPIHLLFISTGKLATSNGNSTATVCHPRVLVVAEDRVEATIVESYVGPEGSEYFTNAVTEFVTGVDCRIDHCKLQQESKAAYHIATMQVDLGSKSQFVSHAASLGAKLSRNDLNVIMNGEYATATLNGLVIIGGEQHCDNHTLLHHEKPNCPSYEMYKHVLSDKASCVFKGQIYVQKDAQKTDSKQSSKTLLLSDDAYMNSQPALEIYADDVKCTHGSTTGPVDEGAVFYLRSRGISLESAKHLMSYAFAADVSRRIRVVPVRRRLEDFMAAHHGLPQDLRITDLGSHDEKSR